MNIFNQIKVILLGTFFLIGFCQFTTSQISEKDLIIGTWTPEGSPDSRMVFEANGTCKRYSNNINYHTYTWTIPEEGVLKLVDNKTNEIYKYELDFSEDKNTLELIWFDLPSKSLFYFRN